MESSQRSTTEINHERQESNWLPHQGENEHAKQEKTYLCRKEIKEP